MNAFLSQMVFISTGRCPLCDRKGKSWIPSWGRKTLHLLCSLHMSSSTNGSYDALLCWDTQFLNVERKAKHKCIFEMLLPYCAIFNAYIRYKTTQPPPHTIWWCDCKELFPGQQHLGAIDKGRVMSFCMGFIRAVSPRKRAHGTIGRKRKVFTLKFRKERGNICTK